MSKLVITMDSTQLSTFSECPMLWNIKHRECLELNQFASGESTESGGEVAVKMDARSMGSYGHKVLEHYYHGRSAGLDTNKSLNQAINHPKWILPEKEAISMAAAIAKLGEKNIAYINERIRNYTYVYLNDFIPKRLEVGFSHLLHEDHAVIYILEGRIDFLGTTFDGMSCFVDHKFQSTRKQLYEKAIQFRNYALVTGELFGIINYIRMAKTIDKYTFVRQPISFSKLEINAWKTELIEMYDEVAATMRNGTFKKRRNACTGKFNYPCMGITLCDEPTPALVEIKKQTMYTKVDAWTPWHESEA